MNQPLTMPDHDLSRSILATTSYADRFHAGRLLPPVGIIPGTIRSLPELHLLLAPDDLSLPGVNPLALADWVEHVIGDPDLAQALRAAHGAAQSYVAWCLTTYELVGSRVDQARRMLGEEVA